MRAKEFINEVKSAKMTKRQQQSTRGVNTYADKERWNADYVAYRLGMAVAGADGTNTLDIDPKSWIGKSKATFPYSKIEQEMLDQAYKAVGASVQDLNHGDMESQELDSTNIVSPVADWMKPKKVKESASSGATGSGSIASSTTQGGGWLFGGTVGAPKDAKKKSKVIKRTK